MGKLPDQPNSNLQRWVIATALMCTNSLAVAQEASTIHSIDHQVNEAFRQVFKDPGDQEASTRYARLLVASGNYEGGIAALERRLIGPDPHPSIRVELGVLYYRLGSYQMSEGLLRQALADTRLADEQRATAEALLRDLSARNQPSQLTGNIMIGMRQQTNPSARSEADQVYSAGTLVPLAQGLKPKKDNDLQLTARLDHRYDLGWQNEATLVSSLTGQIVNFQSSSGRQLQANQEQPYNLAWAEITTGIRFKPAASSLPGWRIRPYLILTELAAQGHRYFSNQGLGLESDYQVSEKTLASATYEYRNYKYSDRIDITNAALLGGPDNHLRFQLSHELAPGHIVNALLAFRDHKTGLSYYNFDGQELRLTYSTSYASPISGASGGYWQNSLWAGVTSRKYGAADPGIRPDVVRKDEDWRLGANLSLPLSGAWSFLIQLEQVRTQSNITNYQNKNTSSLGALSYRF